MNKYININLNITDDQVTNCDATCKLVLKNLKNSSKLVKNSNLVCDVESSNCFINFGIIPLNDINAGDNTKYVFDSIRIIKNPNIKINSKTTLKNTDLFFYLVFKGKRNLYMFIPIINNDSSNNYEVSKFINTTKNIDISDLYQTVFPDMHSFYFFEKKTKDEHTDNIIIFDNHKGIRTPEYFTIKDELILNSTNEPLDNVLNVFYSNKLNCLYNHIDLSKKELTSVIEKMHKEKYSESDGLIEHPNGNPEKSGKEEDVKFNGYKLFISFLILIYFCPPIFKWIIEKIVDKQWQEESIIFLAVIILVYFGGHFWPFKWELNTDLNIFLPSQLIFLLLYFFYNIAMKSSNNSGLNKNIFILIIVFITLCVIIISLTVLTQIQFYSTPVTMIGCVIFIILFFGGLPLILKSDNKILIIYSILFILYGLFSDPSNFMNENDILKIYDSKNSLWFTILKISLFTLFTIITGSIFSKIHFDLDNIQIPKIKGPNISKYAIIFILILLILGVILNIFKLTNQTYVKELKIEDINNDIKAKEFINCFKTEIVDGNIQSVTYTTKDEHILFSIYYYKNDNKFIIKKIQDVLNNCKNKEGRNLINNENYTITDKQYNELDKIYNSPVLIFVKLIIILMTVISIFIENHIYDIILLIILIIFLLYSVFGLYYIQEHNITLVLSIIVTIIYFLIYITKIVLQKELGSKYKEYSNLNLYLILFLITLCLSFIVLRINDKLSGNILIYGTVCLIILFSGIFYFISIRDISINKGSNAHVSISNQNSILGHIVTKQKNSEAKEITAHKAAAAAVAAVAADKAAADKAAVVTRNRSRNNGNTSGNTSRNNGNTSGRGNRNTSGRGNRNTSGRGNRNNGNTSGRGNKNRTTTSSTSSSATTLANKMTKDELFNIIESDLESLNKPTKSELNSIKEKIKTLKNKTSGEHKDFYNHTKEFIRQTYPAFETYVLKDN